MSPEVPARDIPFKFRISKLHKRIKSTDSRLSTDGGALHEFLVAQLSEPPKVLLRCRGYHTETVKDNDGVDQTNEINDFFFLIDLAPLLQYDPAGANSTNPPIWILGDKDPAYRGRRFLQVDETLAPSDNTENGGFSGEGRRRRAATDAEQLACEVQKVQQASMGLPPWVLLNDMKRGEQVCLESEDACHRLQNAAYTKPSNANGPRFTDNKLQPSSKTLREWADNYCASWRPFREFHARKMVYGWDMMRLNSEVRARLATSKHPGCENVAVDIIMEEAEIVVYGGFLGRTAFQPRWLWFLLRVTIVYPLVVFLLKHVFGGNGMWDVAGSAFALVQWVHVEGSLPGETVEEYRERVINTLDPSLGESPLKATPKGVSQLRGVLQEGWLESKREEIVRGISSRLGETKFVVPDY